MQLNMSGYCQQKLSFAETDGQTDDGKFNTQPSALCEKRKGCALHWPECTCKLKASFTIAFIL